MPKTRPKSAAQRAHHERMHGTRWAPHEVQRDENTETSAMPNPSLISADGRSVAGKPRSKLSDVQQLGSRKRTREESLEPDLPDAKRHRSHSPDRRSVTPRRARSYRKRHSADSPDAAQGNPAPAKRDFQWNEERAARVKADKARECAEERWAAAERYWNEREGRLKRDKHRLRNERDAAISAARENEAAAGELASQRADLAHVRDTLNTLDTANKELRDKLRATEAKVESQERRLTAQKRSTHRYRMRSVRAKAAVGREKGRKQQIAERTGGRWVKGKRGSWSPLARKLARTFRRAGCSAGNVGSMMQVAAEAFSDIKIPKMSRRTVDRAIGEAGLAAIIQLGDEISTTNEHDRGLTVSDDGTSHRGKNIIGRHMTVKTADSYAQGEDQDNIQVKTRFVEIAPEVNHKMATQVDGWKNWMKKCATEYNLCPMSTRLGKKLDRNALARSLFSKLQDHSNDAKGSAKGVGKWGEEVRIMDEGMKVINALPSNDEREHGIFARLPADIESPSDELLEDTQLAWALELGLEALDNDSISAEVRARIFCFIESFCGSHKELRAGEAFSKAMKSNLAPETPIPVALPNAYNRTAMSSHSASSDAKRKAETETTGGGVKLASLVGLVLHHSDTKRGYQDVATDFFEMTTLEEYGEASAEKYAQTTATRFQSYFKGALWIAKHSESLAKLVHIVVDKRADPVPSNIENNILRALEDIPTITEIICMSLYYLIISVPFMRIIRQPGLNYFDCKPIYDKMLRHIDILLEQSDHLIFAPDIESRGKECTYDGYDWEDFHGIRAIARWLPKLPHVRAVWRAGLLGAKEGWHHYTTEFRDGGRIAQMSAQARLAHFAPAVNDHNEGILGSARQYSFKNSHANWRSFTDQATVARNDTENWMERNFVEEDYDHLMRRFREKDASGEARAQRSAQLAHDAKAAEEARETRQKKAAEQQARLDALLKIPVARDEPAVLQLTNPQLKEQLRYHREVRKEHVGAYSKLRQAELRQELLRLIQSMNINSGSIQPGDSGTVDEPRLAVERLAIEPGLEDDDGWEDDEE